MANKNTIIITLVIGIIIGIIAGQTITTVESNIWTDQHNSAINELSPQIPLTTNPILITQITMDKINTLYQSNYPHEFALALDFKQIDNQLTINSWREIEFSSNSHGVVFSLNKRDIAMIHSHPNHVNKLSNKDIFHFGSHHHLKLSCIIYEVNKISCWDRTLTKHTINIIQ